MDIRTSEILLAFENAGHSRARYNRDTFIADCTQCGKALDVRAMDPGSITSAMRQFQCLRYSQINVDALDKMLEVLNKRNVAHCKFNSDGSLKTVVFRYPDFGVAGIQGWLPGLKEENKEAKIFAMPAEAPVQRKESDIDLALNPPADVRYPVDDGKE